MTNLTGGIQIKYRLIDGCHVLTSEEMGLYVAHRDMQQAFTNVPAILQELIAMRAK